MSSSGFRSGFLHVERPRFGNRESGVEDAVRLDPQPRRAHAPRAAPSPPTPGRGLHRQSPGRHEARAPLTPAAQLPGEKTVPQAPVGVCAAGGTGGPCRAGVIPGD